MTQSLRLATLLLLSLCTFTRAQDAMPLWPDGAPGALGKEDKDIPTLTAYLPAPDIATGAAIVVCPGGGYGGLAGHEGADYALFLNQHGVAAFVLKYRLGSAGYRHQRMLEDAVILPNVVVGRNVTLRRVVVDKNCVLPDGFKAGVYPAEDRGRFHVTERGVTLITPKMLEA